MLLQYVQDQGLVVTDETVRQFIKALPYFQTDGQFDDKKYKSLLTSQRLSSTEFIGRVKNALVMEQFQHAVVDSSFATQHDIESFFKIQNQQRDLDFITVKLEPPTEPFKPEEISAYYQQHQDLFKSPEEVSIEYVELSLAEMAKKVSVTDEKLKAYYEEQKDQYSTLERRKISHILFAVTGETDEKTALAKAQKAKQDLAGKDFAVLAQELSDDKITAKAGGDLGLFNTGAMEKSFEDAALTLKQGEVSDPVKTAFGYHLIKVTELTAGESKPFETVKAEVTQAYQKAQAENAFYEAGEKLSEMSYENPDNLQTVADAIGLTVKKTGLFNKAGGDGIAAEEKIRNAAFSEEVLQGNNSTPIELGNDVAVVLRLLEHKPAAIRELKDVELDISLRLTADKAKQLTAAMAQQIKSRLQAGEAIAAIAVEYKLEVKNIKDLSRRKSELPEGLNQAIFKAAKPVGGKPSIFIAPLPNDEQAVVSLTKVTDGVMSDDDKKQVELGKKSLGNTFGQAQYAAVINSLQSDADITISKKAQENVEQ